MAKLTITLPDQLAEQAEQMGLLENSALSSLLTEAIRNKQIGGLFEAGDRLAALDLAAMSPEEVQKEIQEARRELRARRP